MAIEIKAPQFPESVADGTVATWHKQPGDAVKRDELIVDIETDKVVMEVLAEADGVLSEIVKNEGDTVLSGELLGKLDAGATASAPAASAPAEAAAPAAPAASAPAAGADDAILAPAARKLAEENGIDPNSVKGTGKDGRVTKEDLVAAIEAKKSAPAASKPAASTAAAPVAAGGDRTEKRVPMTRLRAKVAERLVEAQSNMAMLTTFNEVDMTEVMALRSKYKDLFEKTHNGVRLGFMSFFVKASVEALKRFPAVNASIDGTDIVYHGYQDIGVAVSSDRGLVVPVLRNAELMNLAEVESGIATFGKKARDGKLSIDEMTGGTFTITNGGTFGSMMSTPIVNPPQAAILGMHNILQRPMAVNGQVVIRPMMYLALSYDHRLIDGKEAVSFLVTIKNLLEDPARLLLDI
ncbi:MAG: 2-oxoglutarate dehydrogenase complex dihydrolipoyllysine-residue succinyltransferase [Gammaproteobacteria bacterium]|jgi:2-oxoglutarate dehydrogenase E2 component (dihydrolipoamide succinyltransferase)|uniref:2-oxoglutarate dehydrogenase complex dihydrolipoyllysine-residue succinyltransferase n=1 Tax=Stutzerimonas xanthomarina TaxID=271420 RepID=UPI000E97BF9F|nr:2-oxoglutarate dehydrogenase complex dihydrolipoyllysine-residue succinyltransferase [Stutzerimonas xanthomarina]MBU0812402.1 2-oxoglutarate dehydrogenase complex dihydrolipoyllysine-residue succinyltransferase [Gammaproteobacteria bacterium]HAW23114.1 dihydrolipoamide succinyltransferase [Pseudomonas sp.]MBK3848625.1 2-oxoglutarate dehydrogenase complex dihydrolipoyllysine-residue succinyltransferase [Stutzerimonas xanthomarina]MBU1302430.1 2-oxoglutarate dehydrogenase complex dihydrolipoyl|tara:strand:+ start:1712 stop:2938 length:1227 start_codon:yes stop_codon:yes gene_type:complete